ncbi:unnamed protein product, partial [Brassica oleracea]
QGTFPKYLRNENGTVSQLRSNVKLFLALLFVSKLTNGSGNNGAAKKGRGSNGMQSQLVNKAFEGFSSYGGGNRSRGRRGGGRGRRQGRGRA